MTAQQIQIDFVSDVACPWCAIGLSSLQQALAQLGDSIDAHIVMHPFELNPTMTAGGQDAVEYLSRKYGRTPEQIAETQAMIRERGAAVGFEFGSRTRVYNTFDAHRLLHWAGVEGKQVALKQALLRAYHTDGKDPGNHDVLIEAARSVGLDAEKVRDVLENNRFADEVRAEEQEYQAMGIQSVPAVIFNRRYLVSGGQPAEVFEQAIRQIVSESA
ncbi:disulfide bond formation protein DsbA [Trinickia dabaoshanensis]|uniref:Disulfide bond formation protein DsbA n=1 Tax=Trinickia dabaoshanensis TaxID=564714 RepID=A0A2N7VD10_9BURK|nr:DsbA family oxidoreductase [Trinickia dabaoshanensis]PMS14984.1 disulfide bond formation protein DsbA [Trinickia dabaoshanensis]